MPACDDRLHRYIESAIQQLPQYPDIALQGLTGIEQRALDLVWERVYVVKSIRTNAPVS